MFNVKLDFLAYEFILIEKILKWKHNSGFSGHNGMRFHRTAPNFGATAKIDYLSPLEQRASQLKRYVSKEE